MSNYLGAFGIVARIQLLSVSAIMSSSSKTLIPLVGLAGVLALVMVARTPLLVPAGDGDDALLSAIAGRLDNRLFYGTDGLLEAPGYPETLEFVVDSSRTERLEWSEAFRNAKPVVAEGGRVYETSLHGNTFRFTVVTVQNHLEAHLGGDW